MKKLICGSASDSLYLTFKGGCRQKLDINECYRCVGCGGRFHKDCIKKHFELEKKDDIGRNNLKKDIIKIIKKL